MAKFIRTSTLVKNQKEISDAETGRAINAELIGTLLLRSTSAGRILSTASPPPLLCPDDLPAAARRPLAVLARYRATQEPGKSKGLTPLLSPVAGLFSDLT